MYVGALELDVLFGDVRSLKQKRSLVRPVIAELRQRFDVAAAEAGHAGLHRRSLIGVAAVAVDAGHVREVLDACERLVARRPELELLAARHRMLGPDDDECGHPRSVPDTRPRRPEE
ncbi:MAG TPA: DUF503 domain-containing protein [Pseudonocardiaceae bacterium]|nr:DUF503 domain-containing protein [Pseudonocardiaceae bacterium]